MLGYIMGRVVAVHTPPRAVDATRTVNPSRRAVRRPRRGGSSISTAGLAGEVAWTLRKSPERVA